MHWLRRVGNATRYERPSKVRGDDRFGCELYVYIVTPWLRHRRELDSRLEAMKRERKLETQQIEAILG